jgi:hypothetical protein
MGNCIVDKVTGLNCKWFLLQTPETIKIGDVVTNTMGELQKKVIAYRNKCWDENRETINECAKISYTFGGCGGNPSEIIRRYKEMHGIDW